MSWLNKKKLDSTFKQFIHEVRELEDAFGNVTDITGSIEIKFDAKFKNGHEYKKRLSFTNQNGRPVLTEVKQLKWPKLTSWPNRKANKSLSPNFDSKNGSTLKSERNNIVELFELPNHTRFEGLESQYKNLPTRFDIPKFRFNNTFNCKVCGNKQTSIFKGQKKCIDCTLEASRKKNRLF